MCIRDRHHPGYARGAQLHCRLPEVQSRAGAAACRGRSPLRRAPFPVRRHTQSRGRRQHGAGRRA
eukprot:2024728-Alexandrium_andersonii.AAC.1